MEELSVPRGPGRHLGMESKEMSNGFRWAMLAEEPQVEMPKDHESWLEQFSFVALPEGHEIPRFR